MLRWWHVSADSSAVHTLFHDRNASLTCFEGTAIIPPLCYGKHFGRSTQIDNVTGGDKRIKDVSNPPWPQ